MIEAVIIDLDDTFSLTEAVSFDIENALLNQMGRPPMSRKVHLETWERPLAEALQIRSPGIDAAVFKALYDSLLSEYAPLGRLENISEENYKALDVLTALGKTLIVLTSRTRARLKHILEPDHALFGRIKAFYYRENSKFRKPDPRVFDELLDKTGLLPEQCVYVGDSLHDAKAAKKAGLYFIASLESGLRQEEDFEGFPVDVFIRKFPDVVTAVQHLERSMPISL